MDRFIILLLVLQTGIIVAQKKPIKNGGLETGLSNWRGNAGKINSFDKKQVKIAV